MATFGLKWTRKKTGRLFTEIYRDTGELGRARVVPTSTFPLIPAMKSLALFVLCASSCVVAFAQIPSSATLTKPDVPAAPPAPTTITVPTTAAELASGYASAIPQMSLKSLVIFMKSEGKVIPIKGIRSARAMGGVLLIVFSAGDMMAINAEQIVMITDGSRTPFATPTAPVKE